MTPDTKATVIATILATLISSFVSIVVSFILKKRNDKTSLDSQLSFILRLAIEYPYLESKFFTSNWKENCQNPDDKYRRYETYATLVFNYLEDVCEFFNYDREKVEQYINIKSWISLHRDYWHNPTDSGDNEKSYNDDFKAIVHEILGEIQQ